MMVTSSFAKAYTQLDVKESLDVYRKPIKSYRPFARLKPGSIAELLENNSTIYYKIKFSFNGRKVYGYIKKEDLFESVIQKEGTRISNKSLGVYVSYDLMYQPEHEIATQVGSGYTVDASSSLAPVFGVALNFPVNDPFVVELFGQYKISEFKKTFKNKDSGLGTVTTSLIRQSFVGGGAIIKYRFEKSLFGAGMEFDSGQSVEIKTISGTPVETNQSSKPLFIQPVLVWEKPLLWGKWAASWKIRSGVIVNTKPVIATFAIGLTIGYGL